MTTANDTIDRLAGLTDQSPVFATRRQRDKVAIATQACEDLLLGDGLADSLSRAERRNIVNARDYRPWPMNTASVPSPWATP